MLPRNSRFFNSIEALRHILVPWGFVVICLWLIPSLFAQPQAPIVWGPMRVLRDGGQTYMLESVYGQGDTLVLLGGTGAPPSSYTAACVSGDNGITWSDWHVFPISPFSDTYAATVAFTSQGIYCCAQAQDMAWALYRTTNLGQSWSAPTQALPSLRTLAVRHDTIFAAVRRDSLTWTADGGAHWAPRRGTGLNGHISGIALSSQYVHAVCGGTSSSQFELRYARAPLYEGPFEPYREIHPDIFATADGGAIIGFDSAGHGVIVSGVYYHGGAIYNSIVSNTSTDDGITWSQTDTLQPIECANPPTLGPWRQGRQWMAVWPDTALPNEASLNLHCLFSANGLRSRYPLMRIPGDSLFPLADPCVTFSGNRVRASAPLIYWNGVWGSWWVQWEGTITPDTLAPVLETGVPVDDEIPQGATITFLSTAWDNDSLWRLEVVLKRQGSADSVVVPLTERVTPIDYRGTWTVPNDTALWHYYYRAEDMWENVSVYPDSGVFSFHTSGWNVASSLGPYPLALSLSVSPNPFNPATVITFTVPHAGDAVLTVYDIAGRQVQTLCSGMLSAGEHRIAFDGSRLSSGLYPCRLRAGTHSQTCKLLLLK